MINIANFNIRLNLIDILTIILSIIALVISVKSWAKSRSIYKIETEVLRQPTGRKEDMYISTDHINKKMESGEYTILHIAERKADGDWELILGKIKK